MPAGSVITYRATGTVSPSAMDTISNTANVALPDGGTDPNLTNNSATDVDTITFKADLEVTITDGKSVAVAGSKNTYTIVLTNMGPSNVAGAVVRDSFPSIFTG